MRLKNQKHIYTKKIWALLLLVQALPRHPGYAEKCAARLQRLQENQCLAKT